jgi:PAS domain S-box-containing protein
MMKFNSKSRIAFGQVGLLTSVLLLASFLQLIPDLKKSVREGRTALAEVIAAKSSALMTHGDIRRLEMELQLVVERNDQLLSAGLRTNSRRLIVAVGPHKESWQQNESDYSSDSQVKVPIWTGSSPWGSVELRFEPLSRPGWQGVILDPIMLLVSFVSVMCFIVFYIYLGRMLKELNPSAAVPARVRSALDTIAGSLLVINAKGNVVLANLAFAELTGRSSESLIGVKAGSLSWVTHDADAAPVWKEALEHAESSRHEDICFRDSNGKIRTFIVNCSPVLGAQSKAGGVLISMEDVTELQEKEALLRESMEAADQANQAKSAFLSNMSHEIRTPMTAILGFTEVLRRSPQHNESDRQKYLETISKSGEHLLELINDVLDLSKVESGAMEVEALPCNVAQIANDVVEVLRVRAEEKGIVLSLELTSDLPMTIKTDPSRLRQVFTNLAGNAIKFTERGNVRIELSLDSSSGEGMNTLQIRVIDSGIGMSEQQQTTIFDAFTQADVSIARRFGGTGLGLSISRQLTAAMGGTLTVSSEEGVGSTFLISFPLEQELGALSTPAEIRISLESVKPQTHVTWQFPPSHILVVDDGPENRQLLSVVLSDLGLQVSLAENGQEALDAVKNTSFDVVLMDIQMPVMDGYEAVKAMRDRGIEWPIMALTANAMAGYEARILEAGFSHYMSKPINLDKLSELLAQLLGGTAIAVSESHDVADDSPMGATDGSDVTLPAEQAMLISPYLMKDLRFAPIISEFKDRVGQRLKEVHEAIELSDWQTLGEIGHWLKGSAGTVGLDDLVGPAQQLEEAANSKSTEQCQVQMDLIESIQARIAIDADSGSSFHSIEHNQGISVIHKTGASPHPVAAADPAGDRDSACLDDDTRVVSTLPVNQSQYYEIVELFITRLQEQIETMRVAVSNTDYEVVAELAHWLRGSGGNVGFEGFMPLADLLEASAIDRSESIHAHFSRIEKYTRRVLIGWEYTQRKQRAA